MLVEVLYFSSVKPLQVEVGSSLSGEKASPSPAPISHGERNIPMFEGRVVVHDSCLFVAHMLVEVLYFSFVKPLQVEVGSSLSGEKASPSPAPISHGERTSPCLRDESSCMTGLSGGVLAALKAF